MTRFKFDNADMIEAAVRALEPHDHEMIPLADVCEACGRTAYEIEAKRIACDGFINHKPMIPPW